MHTSTRGVPAAPTVNGDVSAEPPHRELFTMKESLSQHRRRRLHHRRHRTDRGLREIDAGHRLLDLQSIEAGPSGRRCDPSRTGERSRRCFPAPRTPRRRRPASERSRLGEDGVAGPRREAGQMVRHRPVRERPPQIVREWCPASGPRRCGFPAPPPARPMLRSCRSRPPVDSPSADPRDAPGPRAFRARRGTSAARGTGGNARPVFPATAPATAPAIAGWSIL